MITRHWNSVRIKAVLGVFLFLLGACLSARAERVDFLTSSIVPAARGYAKVKKDGNRNYSIDIRIRNLAEVDRLSPSRETYVIWMVTDKGVSENIGRLKSSAGFLSRKLKATFSSTTTEKPSRFYITAENDAGIGYSISEALLTTAEFRK